MPEWVPLKKVKFLYVQRFLDIWWLQIGEAIAGVLLLVALIHSAGMH